MCGKKPQAAERSGTGAGRFRSCEVRFGGGAK